MRIREEGFSLVEVMIALMILAIGIMALQKMQGESINQATDSGSISTKSRLCASQVERIINLDFDVTTLDNDLVDTDGDGTNQDRNLDGLDDDDDGNASITLANEQFGLRHSECCADGNSPRGDAVPGCQEFADHCDVYEDFDIYWNVAVDHPTTNTRTVTITVVRQTDIDINAREQNKFSANRAEYTYVKAQL